MNRGSIEAGTKRRARAFCASVLVLGAYACLMRHASDSEMTNTTLITEFEIDSVHASSAFDAVRQLRPMFLISRGKLSLDPTVPPALPNVYVDNQFYGDASTLRNISAAAIDSIKFFSAAESQYRFGRGNAAGVIEIFTKH